MIRIFYGLTQFLSQELRAWKTSEIIWMIFCLIATIAVSLAWQSNLLAISSAVAGMMYTLLAGKGKISCYLWGIYNSLSYGWIAYTQTLYGETMLNWGIYFPMMFIGLVVWKNKRDTDGIIIKERLVWKARAVYALMGVVAIVLYALFLQKLGDEAPWIDSSTNVLSIIAIILTLRRSIEQWFLWTVVNVLSIVMWWQRFMIGGDVIATLMMWIVALCCGLIFWYRWHQDMRQPQTVER